MRARDQSSIFSTGGKFRPDYGLLLELHALNQVARYYALLVCMPACMYVCMHVVVHVCMLYSTFHKFVCV